MYRYKTFFDRFDPQLLEFRNQVCFENGGDARFLEKPFTYRQTRNELPHLNSDALEEIYKFGRLKWEQQAFHSIEAILVNDRVVSISACERYGEHALRVGMCLYTLKSYRSSVRGLMFTSGGLFERHLAQARNMSLKGVFLSVYPHTKKLEFHARNLGIYKRSIEGTEQPYLAGLEWLGMFHIKNVDQYVIGHRFDTNEPWKFITQGLMPAAPI